jgi:hypothetical protein
VNQIPVSSSNIASVGYDVATQTLQVEFLSGSLYQYFDVPQNIFDEFINAASKGKYFAAQIKGIYRYAKV